MTVVGGEGDLNRLTGRRVAELNWAALAGYLWFIHELHGFSQCNFFWWFCGCSYCGRSISRRRFVVERLRNFAQAFRGSFQPWRFCDDDSRRRHVQLGLRGRQALNVMMSLRMTLGFRRYFRCVVTSARSRVGHGKVFQSRGLYDVAVMSLPVPRVQTWIFCRRRRKVIRRRRRKFSDFRFNRFDFWFAFFFMHRVRRVDRVAVEIFEVVEAGRDVVRRGAGRLLWTEDGSVEWAHDLRVNVAGVVVDFRRCRDGLPPGFEVVRLALHDLHAVTLLE